MSAGDAAPAGTGAPPVCPRHADRVSYTRCQRCERPACPECQVPAAVGFQCVDCVREQRRTVPAARTSLGSRLDGRRPVVTYAVLVTVLLVFVAQQVATVTDQLAFVPVLSRAEPWRFLSVALVHGSVLHIALNGFVLWQVGREAEAVMGRWRYLAVLALTTVAGSVAILWLTPATADGSIAAAWQTPTVGISGAVFGLFGALLAIEAANRRPIGRQFVTILIFALLGVVIPNISWQGHVGGLIGGVLAGAVLARAPRSNRTAWQIGGLVAVTVLFAALTAVRWSMVEGCLAVTAPGGFVIPSCG